MHIGLFFGSFNPIHIGHLIIANHVLNETQTDQIWFIVSPLNPFKESTSLLDEHVRLALVQRAVAGNDRLVVKDIEFHLPRPSYTAHTLSWLEQNHSNHVFSIIMGSDSLRTLQTWKQPEHIVDKYKLLIYRRPGFAVNNEMNASLQVLNSPLLGISSTDIRHLIKNGKSIRYLVPDSVRDEIETNNYYR